MAKGTAEAAMRRTKQTWVAVLAALLSVFPALGQQPSMALSGTATPDIQIGAGDLISVVVFDTPELTQQVRVNQDGQVNLPVLGSLQLGGLNSAQAARLVEQELKRRGLLNDPHVTVFVTEYATQGASVLGEVKSPGVYPTLGTRRLMDMLSLAGGLSPTAGKAISIVHRDDPQYPVVVALQSSVQHMEQQQNPVIQPGDTITVGKAGVVYVLGDVTRPGGFLVDNNDRLTVLQSLALAGGANKTAALSKTMLIHKVPEGRQEVALDLSHVYHGKQADISVTDGDILFVPSSLGKTLGYRGIEAAIAAATGVLIYAQSR